MLMQERPEFVGRPMRITRAELVQDSPQVVVRKVSDDISTIRAVPPEISNVEIEMTGRRDYRGLRTILDMSGGLRAEYILTNATAEPLFALFKCPHPRTENGGPQGLLAGELKLKASSPGIQENAKEAWVWSGMLEPHSSTTIEVSYRAAALKGFTYRAATQGGEPIKSLRVAFQRKDIASMRFDSNAGTTRPGDEKIVWERKNFLGPDSFSAEIEESRNLHASLSQLLEMGPLVYLLFLLASSAVILARQPLSGVQMLSIAAGYAFYFPLILYLSANFRFVWALVIAVAVPGTLLVNYARWLLGGAVGLLGGVVFLLLYQVFPTLAAFAGWNRGMVLLTLGIVTFGVLIHLQNRSFKRKSLSVMALLLLAMPVVQTQGAEAQILLPASLVHQGGGSPTNSLIAFDCARYQVRHEAKHFEVQVEVPYQVLRVSDGPVFLFTVPIHLERGTPWAGDVEVAQALMITNRLALWPRKNGQGILRLSYRVPIETREGKKKALIPLLQGPSGDILLGSPRDDLEYQNGALWGLASTNNLTTYRVGVTGEDSLGIQWSDEGNGSLSATRNRSGEAQEFYGIGISRLQHLTVINSDGSCTHFTEVELPASRNGEFRMRLPERARLISVLIDGSEISAPAVEDQVCRIQLPAYERQKAVHRLSLRVAYPPMRLGFVGLAELTLPEVYQTTGSLEWVVALPNGFDTQILSSGLETQKAEPDLARFGEYGRILKSLSHTYLAKSLAPPGKTSLTFRYRQIIAGL
jgi:hypothetical protein